MQINIDDSGNLIDNGLGQIATTPDNEINKKNFICELRVNQGAFWADLDYGKSPLSWYLSQSPLDRMADLKRIVDKYGGARAISYNEKTKKYDLDM